MKKIIFVALLFALIGCDDYPQYRNIKAMRKICSDEDIPKKASFILECLKNSNPKSDEEPEDWMPICERMAEKTFCKKETFNVTQRTDCNQCSWQDTEFKKKSKTED